MFTAEERDRVRDHILELARSDPRVTGGALTGSRPGGAEDRWSDIDLAFGVAEGTGPRDLLESWTERFRQELGTLHHWDLPSGTWVYRVFLLPSGLEVDIGVAPQEDFGARGPNFQLLFGEDHLAPAPTVTAAVPPSEETVRYLVGLCWHHVLHARTSLEREKPWRAQYWIAQLRDHLLELAALRFGEQRSQARGADRLPVEVTAPLTDTLVRSLDQAELRRALAAATMCFLRELAKWDRELSRRLEPLVLEYGGAG